MAWLPSGLLAQENDHLPRERHRPPVEEPQTVPPTDPTEDQEETQTEESDPPEEALPQAPVRQDEVIDSSDTEIEPDPGDTEAYDETSDIARRDLAAQESMAESTVQLRISGWFQVGIGVAAVILLAWTLYYTSRAVKEAAKGSAAALKAVEVTRTLGVQQLRAYVNATDIRVRMFCPGQIATFRLNITNTGNTPAYKVRILTVVIDSETPEAHVGFRGRRPESRAIISGGGGMFGHQAPVHIPANLYAAVASGDATIVMAGYIRYRDVFDKPRGSTFKTYLRFVDISDGDGAMTATKRNNYSN